MNASPGTRGLRPFRAILLLAALGAGCGAPALRATGDAPLFDRLAESSWTRAEPVRTFGPDNLYQEIDGEAELFLPYGFRDLSVGVLSPAGRPSAQLRLELFRLGSGRDAFGVYSQHRFPGQEIASAGPSEAIVSDASLDFFRGDRFVRIRASGAGVSRADLVRLGEDASRRLAGSGSPPPEAAVLALPGLVPGTVVYHRRALLGYEGLAPGYEAKIDRGAVTATIVLIPPEAPPRAAEAVLRGMPDVAALGGGRYRAGLRSGALWLGERGGYRVGAAGTFQTAAAELLLDELETRLERFLASRGPERD